MAQKKIQDIYPLSPMQQGMLFHSLLEPNSGAYIIQTSFELHGYFNLTAFAEAWQKLVDKHSILRTAFVWDNLEQPLQVVGTTAKISLTEHDWQQISPLKQPEKLATFQKELKQTGFNLNKAPLMRLDLIKMRSQVYKFVWTYHHLLLDGWSVPLLLKELLGYYQSLFQGLNISTTSAIPYKNYIAWLKQQDTTKARKFWQEELKGFYSFTCLGRSQKAEGFLESEVRNQESEIKKQRFDNADASYLQKELKLSAETTYKIEFLAREYQLTVNILIQAAWAILLHRYSGDRDLVFGATSSGRPPSLNNAQAMVGLFINTLPVRAAIDPQQSLIDWLKELQIKQLARQEHEHTSLLDIHRVSELAKDTPLFESIVVFENYPVESSLKQSLDVLDIRNIQTSEQTNYPLTLYAALDSQLALKILYGDRSFDDRTITNILEHLKTILESIISNPEQKVGQVPMLTTLEKEQLLTINDSSIKDFPQSCFHQLFEAIVKEKAGEKIALIADDGTFTYSELNERANQLARYVRSQGIGRGEWPFAQVGIYLERDRDLLVALLAVMKAGATYIPLDPSYPQERINYIINNAGIDLLITKQDLDRQTFDIDRELSIINLIAEKETIEKQDKSNLDIAISPQDLAYVIYTSGSTGKPKGVAIEHRSLVNFLDSMKEKPGITESDRLLAITTISFDIAALELYLPLLVGGTVVIAPRDIINSDRSLIERIERDRITMMQATPITWKMLLADNWQGKQDLKILCGGEALEPQLARQLVDKGQEVWNMYGPTETTIWSSIYQLPQDGNIEKVYLGKPIANTQFYILDPQLNLVPQGIAGELYIGGAGLARGYLHRGDLTAERFIPNGVRSFYEVKSPKGYRSAYQESQRRFGSPIRGQAPHVVRSKRNLLPVICYPLLYKTGDLVRQLPNGEIEYLGRIDNQIKLRGFRIELGEIETALNQHPDIQTAVVLAQSDRLITYLLVNTPPYVRGARGDRNFASEKIQSFLADKLPAYMIPSSYTILKELPLTPNGKIDRVALSKIDTIRQTVETAYQQPQTEVERAIAQIWQNVLEVDKVGLRDNFFDLGGQSLLMIRVHSQLKEKLAIDISLVDLFRYPTVASLAEHCTVLSKSDRKSKIDPQLEDKQNREQIAAGVDRQKELRKRRRRG
ncbi:MAG: amino acid adenylation domain-containing protein [Cyanobacteria bacterium P01_G01_bin.19]